MSAVAARGVLNDDEIEIGDSPVFVNQRCGTTVRKLRGTNERP